jgi:2-polyprenyl-3-methyl-5-hydroxy-6-metoxy-1,4-benzoquinol methylase
VSNEILKRRTVCRLCNSSQLTFEVDLPVTAIADHYADSPNVALPVYPQDLYQCGECGHVQLLDVIPRERLFSRDYTYRPSRNPSVIEHFESYGRQLQPYLAHLSRPRVLDIGSNDGLFLEVLKNRFNAQVKGIDPAEAAANEANSHGIPTICDFWTSSVARHLAEGDNRYDLVAANNVFAHNDDLQDFARAVQMVVADEGIFATEISYLADIIANSLIGTFFHEHLSHHSLTSIRPFLLREGLQVFDAIPVNTQGGALIVLSSRTSRSETTRLSELISREHALGLAGRRSTAMLRENLALMRRQVNSLIQGHSFRRLVMYGASRSLNLIIDFFGLKELITLIVDSDPMKVGKYLRESAIQIQSAEVYRPTSGDLVFCSAWVHTETIRQRLRLQDVGAKFLSIYPRVELV